MAKTYIVYPVNLQNLHSHYEDGYMGYRPNDRGAELIRVCFDKNQAHIVAKEQAAVNGGIEFIVAEANMVYYTAESPVKVKQWQGEELLPL